MWRRFIAGLRIRERVEGYSVEGEADAVQEAASEEESVAYEAGGFFPTGDEENIAEPTASGFASLNLNQSTGDQFSVENAGTSQYAGHGVQVSIGSALSRRSHSHDLVDSIGQDAEGLMHDKDYLIPPIKVVYGKAAIFNHYDKVERVQEGGFMAEDSPEGQETPPSRGIDEDLAPSITADDKTTQVAILQQAYENRVIVPEQEENSLNEGTSNSPSRVQVEPTAPTGSKCPSLDAVSDQEMVEQLPSSTIFSTNEQDENSEGDQGSLLSEDPDDEDADPEWLV